jgi:hypothetical protein
MTSSNEFSEVPMSRDYFHCVGGVVNSRGDERVIIRWLTRQGAGRCGRCYQGISTARVRSTRATDRMDK